jgi:YHS domain-containing protein
MEQVEPTTKPMAEHSIDPVCGMKVDPNKSDIMTTYEGQEYYFCAEACRREFEDNPERYQKARPDKSKAPKTWWGRYLERVAKANEKLFGGRSQCCH